MVVVRMMRARYAHVLPEAHSQITATPKVLNPKS